MSTHFFDILLLPGPWGEKSVWVFPFLWGEHERWGGWRGSCWGQGPCCEVLNIRASKPNFFFLVLQKLTLLKGCVKFIEYYWRACLSHQSHVLLRDSYCVSYCFDNAKEAADREWLLPLRQLFQGYMLMECILYFCRLARKLKVEWFAVGWKSKLSVCVGLVVGRRHAHVLRLVLRALWSQRSSSKLSASSICGWAGEIKRKYSSHQRSEKTRHSSC